MRHLRLGVSIWHTGSRAELVEKARKIEALGYDTITFPDHLTDRVAPMPALVVAAEATTRLRVGTNVLNNDLRHPVMVAREAAAIDLLTDGRLQLGLGAGSIKSEYHEAGLRLMPGGFASRAWPKPSASSNACYRAKRSPLPVSTTGLPATRSRRFRSRNRTRRS